MKMTSNRVFLGNGLAVVAWAGNRGWEQNTIAKTSLSREEYSSSSIVIAGSFKMIDGPGDMGRWPTLKPGDMGRLLCPGFEPGKYTYAAMEDGSLEFCASTVNQVGILDHAKFKSDQVLPGRIAVPYRHVLIVATGELRVKERVCKAPFIAVARSLEGFEGEMTGKGMLLFRPT